MCDDVLRFDYKSRIPSLVDDVIIIPRRRFRFYVSFFSNIHREIQYLLQLSCMELIICISKAIMVRNDFYFETIRL